MMMMKMTMKTSMAMKAVIQNSVRARGRLKRQIQVVRQNKQLPKHLLQKQ